MFSNSSSVYFSLCFHVWRTNSAQNMHVNYVWHITLVLLMFLMCFTLVLGGKSCNHLSVLCFFSDCILTVFWLYFVCILIVFASNMILLHVSGPTLHWGSMTHVSHVLVTSQAHKNTLSTKNHAHFSAFSPLIKNWNTRKRCRCRSHWLARIQNFWHSVCEIFSVTWCVELL